MRFRVERIVVSSEHNVKGKEINKRYAYVIVVKRWFKKPLYLRLLNDWVNDLLDDGAKVKIELTKHKWHALTFSEKSENESKTYNTAMLIVSKMKEEPDKFILS